MTNIINVYCDETCHLQNRNDHVMVLGAVYCDMMEVRLVSEQIRAIKKKHGLPRLFETKWTKVSPSKIDYYLELVDYFFNESPLKFRAVYIPDKDLLDHEAHNQTHDQWYYKMYYVMLKWLIQSSKKYHFYIDIKDTRGGARVEELHNFLAKYIYDYNRECVERVQQINSHESELLQLADLLIGAIGYSNRYKGREGAKTKIAERIKSYVPISSLSESSSFTYTKFNLFKWDCN